MKIPNKAPCEKVDGLFIDFVLSDYFFFPFSSPSARFAGACLRGRAPTAPRQRPAQAPHLAVKDETRREWKNRSRRSARLSIFKRLKISIFRHQPRKRWGEAPRRDARSKQAPGRAGRRRSTAPRGLVGMGTLWATKSMAMATRRCGAAGLSANGEAQP